MLPPLTAEYARAAAEKAGLQTDLLDMRFESDVRERIAAADLVCLFGHTENSVLFGKCDSGIAGELLTYVSENALVLSGGAGFLDAELAMSRHTRLDGIIHGSPEIPLMQLLSGSDPETTANLTWRRGAHLMRTARQLHSVPEDLFPARHLRSPEYKYHIFGIEADLVRPAVGCSYHCNFCYEYGKDLDSGFARWRGRTAQSLFNELQQVHAHFVGFVDDDVTAGLDTLLELSDMLIESKSTRLFIGTGRVDHLLKTNAAGLKKLERAGFFALNMGLESVRDRTHKIFRKGLTVEKMEKSLSQINQTNILLAATFLLGSPGETESDMMDILSFSRNWGLDSVGTNRLRIAPDTDLHRIVYDSSGIPHPGMECIQGEELAEIKRRIKYGQRTPLRIVRTFLKMYRRQNMPFDPLFLFFSMIQSAIAGTVLEQTRLLPALLRSGKFLVNLPFVRFLNRTIARLLWNPLHAVLRVLEKLRGLPGPRDPTVRFWMLLKNRVYEVQRARFQMRPFQAGPGERTMAIRDGAARAAS